MRLKTRVLRAVAGRRRNLPVALSMRVPGARTYYAFRHGARRVAQRRWKKDNSSEYKTTELHALLGNRLATKWYKHTNAGTRRKMAMTLKDIMSSSRHRGQTAELQEHLARVASRKGNFRDWMKLAANPKATARAFIAAGSETTKKGWVTRRRKYGKTGRRRHHG